MSDETIWETIYSEGRQLNRAPWDCVVSFLMRVASGRSEGLKGAKVLEVGCGSGSNLLFAAQQGAEVYGLDLSSCAIECARKRFSDAGEKAELAVSTLPVIPDFGIERFDFVIDRACLTHCSLNVIEDCLASFRNMMGEDSHLFSSVYGTKHSSCASGSQGADGLTTGISAGTLRGVGAVSFFDFEGIQQLYKGGWTIKGLMNRLDDYPTEESQHEEWHVLASPDP